VQKNNKNFTHYLILVIIFLFSSGCTTLDGPPNPDDPYESFNRSMFAFNEGADKYAFKPVAQGYDFIMPIATSARFVFNTTFGIFGLIDVASDMDLPKQNEDFGQTLAVWGVGSGPYLVLPLIGPSTVRDTAGLAVDWSYFDPIFKRQTLQQSLVTLTIKYIDVRAGLLKATNIIDETALDKYAFVRDAWQLRREFLIYDGNPPDEFDEDELFDDEDLFNDEGIIKDDLLRENKMQNQLEIMTGSDKKKPE